MFVKIRNIDLYLVVIVDPIECILSSIGVSPRNCSLSDPELESGIVAANPIFIRLLWFNSVRSIEPMSSSPNSY